VTVEAPARGAAIGTPSEPRRWSWTWLFVAGVLAIGFVLRFWTRSDLWLDEALSINIARLPLSDLHAALRHDGAPPLYYLLLHFWIQAFGIGDLATRSLSGLISLATLPLAWFAGRRLGGRRVAWFTVLVLAVSPYAVLYATSTRMYALVMLLALAGYLAVIRAVERPSPTRLAVVALVTALLVYTQYWCFYLVGVAGLLLLTQAVRAGSGETRRAAVRNLVAVAVGLVTFIPWVPTFLYQARHTGTPWGNARVPWSSIAEAILHFAGSDQNGETFILLFALVTLVVLAVFGRGVDERVIEFDLRTQPGVRREAVLTVGTLLVGTTASFAAGSAFDARYASVMYPFYVLLVAVGISLFLAPRVRAAVLAVVVAIGIVGGIRDVTTNRTQAAQSTSIIAAEARPGDVVAYCPDQIGPSASRLLRDIPGLVQLTFPDGAAPDRVNWVDYINRIQAASPQAFANRVLARAGTHAIWFVNALGYNHVEGKCEAIGTALIRSRPNAAQRVVQDDSIDEYMGLTVYRS
jgi:4-amino-4-deoxy-L-arabinose transferase-like glycosyltransferase